MLIPKNLNNVTPSEHKPALIVATLVFVVALITLLAFVVWQHVHTRAIEQLRQTGRINLDRIIGQFEGNVAQFRTLPTLIARQPAITNRVLFPEKYPLSENYLLLTAAVSGALKIVLYDASGSPLSGQSNSSTGLLTNAEAQPVSNRPFFKRAMRGALGFEHYSAPPAKSRRFVFARSILNNEGKNVAVVAVEVELERFENQWRSLKDTVLFMNKPDTIILSNRAAMLKVNPTSLIKRDSVTFVGSDDSNTWQADAGFPRLSMNELNSELEIVRRALPLYDLEAWLLVDKGEASKEAYLITALFITLTGLVLSISFAVWTHRRHLISQFHTEHNLNIELEERVAEKSKQLQATQDDLVQAAKLSALGKMSAGIGHELNQPIGTIKNFAINGQRLLALKEYAQVADNLDEIAEQSERMGKIIGHLRAFARNDPVDIAEVDLVKIVRTALSLTQDNLEQHKVHVILNIDSTECGVLGGRIRLEQVIVNIVANAIDAMRDSSHKELTISIQRLPAFTRLSIKDTGHGIDKPESVFEPFYTTKPVDRGHGLGLGLSISHGIVHSLGGHLTCRNDTDGAIFDIDLKNPVRN